MSNNKIVLSGKMISIDIDQGVKAKELQKITKKEFFNQLINNKSKMLLATFYRNIDINSINNDSIIKLVEKAKQENLVLFNNTFNMVRYVKKVNSVCIQFNNDSYLYYNDLKASYIYKYDNCIISITPYQDYENNNIHIFIYELVKDSFNIKVSYQKNFDSSGCVYRQVIRVDQASYNILNNYLNNFNINKLNSYQKSYFKKLSKTPQKQDKKYTLYYLNLTQLYIIASYLKNDRIINNNTILKVMH